MNRKTWILTAALLASLGIQRAAHGQDPKAAPMAMAAPVVICPDNTCCNDCCEKKGGFFAGSELAILKPHFDHGNDSLNSFVDPEDVADGEAADPLGLYENEWNLHGSPRLWLGGTSASGLGGRIRYWWYNDDAENLATGNPDDVDGAGGFPAVQNLLKANLKVHALDFEVIQTATAGRLDMVLAGGMRWGKAKTERYRFASSDNPFDEVRSSFSDFEGLGPTVAVDLRRELGSSRLALIANTRGSFLFGDTTLTMFSASGDDDDENKGGQMVEADDVVWIMELQLGAEYSLELRNGAVMFLKLAWEGQLWAGAAYDGFTHHGGFPDPRPALNIVTARNTADNNLGFVGVTIGGGVRY